MTGTTITSNINELIQLINDQQSLLRYNSAIENEISLNGGTVVYSYNNIIMASEISEELYTKLQNRPYIEFIQDLPLKKFGEIDINLIDQLDVDALSYSDSNAIINGSIVVNTGITYTGSTVDGLSGNAKKPSEIDLENNIFSGITSTSLVPIITNTNLTISASADSWFNYELFANGTSPLRFEIITPSNYKGTLFIKNSNIISGTTSLEGIYNIIVKVSNNYGIDTKNLTLTVSNIIKITNTNLLIYSKVGTQFLYTIESTGIPPKTYNVDTLPVGFTLNNNIISGVFEHDDSYDIVLTVSGLTSSDSKVLKIVSGYAPIFTSPGQEAWEQYYSGYTYQLVANPSGATYSIIGILPPGLQFSDGDTISGTPTHDGTWEVTMKATNPFGEGSRDLIITIYQP